MINDVLRPELKRVLEWKVGMGHKYHISLGKSDKYLYQYLPKKEYEKYLQIYTDANLTSLWKAVYHMCDFFHQIALELSQTMNFIYDEQLEQKSIGYLKHVQSLPRDTKYIYE